MTLLYRSISIFCIALLPLGAVAQESTQILKSIAFEDHLREIPQSMHDQFLQNPFGLPASTNEQMMKAFHTAFLTNALPKDARKAFQKRFSSEHAASVMQWFNKKSIQNVLKADRKAHTLQGIRQRVVNKYELEQNPPGESRINLIQNLADNINAEDTKVESSAIIFRAFVSAFDEFNNQQSFTETQIEGIVGNFRNQVRTQIGQDITQRLLVTYHELDDQSLNDYIEFYNTEAGKWLNEAKTTSFQSSYQSAADRFLNSVKNR